MNTTKYRLNDEFVVNDIDDKCIVLEPNGNEIFIFEQEAKDILKCFSNACSFLEASSKLKADYVGERIDEDLLEFIQKLIDARILSEL